MHSQHHLCLLEPDPFLAGLYARKFEERGWKVTVLEHAEDVLEVLDDEVDVLMMDIIVEDEPGALVRQLRSMPLYANLRIVILSALTDHQHVNELMKQGVDAYLFKGHFIPNEAVEKVHRLLDARVVS